MAATAQIELASRVSSGLTSEFELLCACCRASNGSLDPIEAIPSHLEWDRVLKLASFHRVLPAVHVALKGRVDVPGSILSALDARFTSHIKRVLRFSAELAGIVRQFEDRGIKILCHKGPVLAQQLYGDPAAREFGDLDFLVRPRGVHQARAILCELGYMPRLTFSGKQEREYLRTGYEYVFGSVAEPNLIELQWQILPRFYAIDFQSNLFFERSIKIDFEGRPVRGLCGEDLLLVLCLHAAKHGWSQLGMVRDVAAVSGRRLDWASILEEARRLGVLKILAISLELAQRLLGAHLPEDSTRLLSVPRDVTNILDIQRRMNRCEEIRTDSFPYFRMMMNLRERWRDRLLFAWRLAATPTLVEWQTVNLPDLLFPLHRGVRAWRLAKRGWQAVIPISGKRL